MLDWSRGRKEAEFVRDEIIDFAVGFYKKNPEQPINIKQLYLIAEVLRNKSLENGREDMAYVFELAIKKFPQVRWLYILSEVGKRTGLDFTLPDGTVHKQNADGKIDKGKQGASSLEVQKSSYELLSAISTSSDTCESEDFIKSTDYGITETQYLNKYKATKEELEKAISIGKVRARLKDDGLFVEDTPPYSSSVRLYLSKIGLSSPSVLWLLIIPAILYFIFN